MKGLLSTLLLACAAACAFAQAYAARAIRFVASFPPGGGVDLMSRLVAGALAGRVGQPVVVKKRPGASGFLGTAAAIEIAPNGALCRAHVGRAGRGFLPRVPTMLIEHLNRQLRERKAQARRGAA